MRMITIGVITLATIGLSIAAKEPAAKPAATSADVTAPVNRGLQWLVSVQGGDGGWGQDGGETSYVRRDERLESRTNDVANTAVALLALTRNGHSVDRGAYRDNVRRGVEFILAHVEKSPVEGLAITPVTGTQIQRKLGPQIDTFLTSMLFSEIDGRIAEAKLKDRVHAGLVKTVNKIQANQLNDGSWNISGGWAPILGTSLASRSLDQARQKGVKVEERVMAKVRDYTKNSAPATITAGGPRGAVADAAAASPVAIYAGAQALEQLSRTDKDRRENRTEIGRIVDQLQDENYVRGFGSMGGEEYFSYLNISDSLKRAGRPEWVKWNNDMKARLVSLQNGDGTWAGHHCITGRVAVTSAAILTLVADRN